MIKNDITWKKGRDKHRERDEKKGEGEDFMYNYTSTPHTVWGIEIVRFKTGIFSASG